MIRLQKEGLRIAVGGLTGSLFLGCVGLGYRRL